MTTQQVQGLQEFIQNNPGVSNSELARIIQSSSHELSNLTEGSLRNYIGRVKMMGGEPAPVAPTKNITSAMEPEVTKNEPVIQGYEVRFSSRNVDMDELEDQVIAIFNSLNIPGTAQDILFADLDEGHTVTLIIADGKLAAEVHDELFGYGFETTLSGLTNHAEALHVAIGSIGELAPMVTEDLATQLLSLIGFAGTAEDEVDFRKALVMATSNEPIILSFATHEEAKACIELLSHYEGVENGFAYLADEDVEEIDENSTVETGNPEPVKFSPTSMAAKVKATPTLPQHYDYVLVGIKDQAFKSLNFTAYKANLAESCVSKIGIFGNEARFVELDSYGYINAASGGIGNGSSNPNLESGLNEDYCLYDAINGAIADALRCIPECENVDVNITVLTETCHDWGSRHVTQEVLAELIQKVRSRFGWSINFVVKDNLAHDEALKLGVDSTNIKIVSYQGDMLIYLKEARILRNEQINSKSQKSYAYFGF